MSRYLVRFHTLLVLAGIGPVASLRIEGGTDDFLDGKESVFVYDLPSRLQGTEFRDDDACENLEPGSLQERICLFGDSIETDMDSIRNLVLNDVGQFALGKILYASLLKHPRRTQNPQNADLFFIPSFNSRLPGFGSRRVRCPSADDLLSRLKHLTEETAPRHFWLSPRPAWDPDVCKAFNSAETDISPSAQLLAKVTKLAIEDGSSAPKYLGPKASFLHSIPYPSLNSGLDSEQAGQLHQEVFSRKDRPYLAAAIWGLHGSSTIDDHTGWSERHKLGRQLQKSPKCMFMDLTQFERANALKGPIAKTVARNFTAAMLQATFCIEPYGDTTSRKGLVDALVLGCIPVLVSPLQKQLWPWHLRWDDISVMLEPDEPDVVGQLESIPRHVVQGLRENISAVTPRLAYPLPGQPRNGDAIETLLQGVWHSSKMRH